MSDPRTAPLCRKLFDLDVEHGNESGSYDDLGPETLAVYVEDATALLATIDAVPYS